MDLKLKDQVVVVTGGASGIGRACALGFAAEGAHVAIWDLAETAAKEAQAISAQHPVRALGLAADVTDEQAVNDAAARTITQLATIDHVVHAAAIGSGKFGFPFTNLRPKDWERVLRV